MSGSITIGSSIPALQAQRRLRQHGNDLGAVFERLASGQRINRASDDAAGLSIADSLKVKTRLFTAAQRNINDGVSALNIASATIESQIGIVMRLRELASQTANGTLSDQQR